MNRRNFLKLVGAISAGATGLGALSVAGLSKADIAEVAKWKPLEYAEIDNIRFYAIAHPDYAYRLRVVSARQRWKQAYHFARWERRYGRKHPDVLGEVGTIDGVRYVG